MNQKPGSFQRTNSMTSKVLLMMSLILTSEAVVPPPGNTPSPLFPAFNTTEWATTSQDTSQTSASPSTVADSTTEPFSTSTTTPFPSTSTTTNNPPTTPQTTTTPSSARFTTAMPTTSSATDSTRGAAHTTIIESTTPTTPLTTLGSTTETTTAGQTTESSSALPSDFLVCAPISVALQFPSPASCVAVNAESVANCTWSQSAGQGFPVLKVQGSLDGRLNVTSLQGPEGLSVTVCAGESLAPGRFEVPISISYQSASQNGSTSVQVTFMVDVNESPVIDVAARDFSVPENASLGTVVFTFNVSDPNALAANGTEAYGTITSVQLIHNGSADFRLNETGDGGYRVEVAARLNASETDEYVTSIEVWDGGGLRTVLGVNVSVSDVNEAPRCASYNVTVDVTPLTPVGSVLGRLECWDWDTLPEYRDLVFSLLRWPHPWRLAAVDSNGTITLDDPVTLDTVSQEVVVHVYALGYPQTFAAVTVALHVVFTPPQCMAPLNQLSVHLPDSATVGTCVNNTVTCSKAGGGDSALNETLGTQGPLAWEIVEDTNSFTVYDVCVVRSLFTFSGLYEPELRVSNGTGETTLTLAVTVHDVNQRPQFLHVNLTPTVDLPEDTANGTVVAEVLVVSSPPDVMLDDVVYVWDPDNVTERFGFSTLRFVQSEVFFPNQTIAVYNSSHQSPIGLVTGPPYNLVVQRALVPETLISVQLQAEDKQGLIDVTFIGFMIFDVTPPACVNTSYNVTLPLLKPVGAIVDILQCSDSSNLTFHEIPVLDYKYFIVDGSGVVTLERRVPLHNWQMTYRVLVMDDSALSTNVTINFSVYFDYAPVCPGNFGSVSLTQTFRGIRCQNVTLTCFNLPGLDFYRLSVNYSFTYNSSLLEVQHFQTYNDSGRAERQSTVRICPAVRSLDRSRLYNVSVAVSNDLGSTIYPTWQIGVSYVNQPPRFNASSYTFSVLELRPHNFTVARVVVGTTEGDWRVDVRNGVYVVDYDTDPAFALQDVTETRVWHYQADGSLVPQVQGYFQGIVFGARRNHFTVNGALTAGHTYRFLLTARDYAGAEATTNVTIMVIDVNEPPSCPRVSDTISVDLTLAVGQNIYNVTCSDSDTKPRFKNLTYGEYPVYGSDYFGIHPTTGEVMLTSLLPTDVALLQYDVYVRDGVGLRTNFSLFVDIDRDFEPQCTPSSQSNVTFLETDGSGRCSQTFAVCVDTSGRSLRLTFEVIRDDTQGNIVIIDDESTLTNPIVFKACVQKAVAGYLPVGVFEMVVEINNTLAVTSLSLNVTIADVNQPPYFENAMYNISVPEDVMTGGSVVAIVRSASDPVQAGVLNIVKGDPDTVTPSFAITSLMYAVRAMYVNGTDYHVNNTGPVRLMGSSVVVAELLRPDVIYLCTLMVTDGEGLSANTTLVISVTDVSQAPSCQGPFRMSVDLLHGVRAFLVDLSSACSDPDYLPALRTLRYFAYPDVNATFFNVSENGRVTLMTSIPRDATQLVLNSYAVDGDGLTANVTIHFDIDRDHPPACNPVYEPPQVWVRDSCFRIDPHCSDPTTASGDDAYLRYTFGGSWSSAFLQSVSPNATHPYGEFCYQRAADGTYDVQLHVSNGLGDFNWTVTVQVSYLSAPPKFTVNQYISEVNESAHVGSPVLRVQAEVNGQNASLVYALAGSSWLVQYFSIDSSTGQVSVAQDLSPRVGSVTVGQVSATDPRTGLNSSVALTVKVLDVNEPPTCRPSVLSTVVPWDIQVTDPVATLNCSDPDPTPGFSSLTFNVRDGADMWRSAQSEIRLVSRGLLDADRSLYPLTVVVSDAVFSATVTVTVTVDRAPPKPAVSLSHVQSDSANVTWTFDDDYLPVIRRFTVTVNSSGVVVSQNVSRTHRSYVIKGLTSERQYDVVVRVDGLQSDAISDVVTFTTPPPTILREDSTELQLLVEAWRDDLSNNRSQAFLRLNTSLTTAVDYGLQGLPGYVGCRVRSFRRGSVMADVVLVTNQSLQHIDDLKSAVISLVSTGIISGIPVNSSYAPFFAGGFYIVGPTLTYTSPGKISTASGDDDLLVSESDVIATCTARTPGYWDPVFEWSLGGNDVSGLSSGRFVVSETVRAGSDPFRVKTSLTIRSISPTESGQLLCRVRAERKQESSDVTLQVVARASARLNPATVVVTPGGDVNFTCVRSAGYDADWRVVFSRQQESGTWVEEDSHDVQQGQNSTALSIPRVRSGVLYRYQCSVNDTYSSAVSNEANVIISPPDVKKCPADDEWPSTPAGTTVRLQCPEGYTGLKERTCNADGEWGDTNTSLCVRADLLHYKNIIAEGTTVNSTWKIVERVANTTNGTNLLSGDVRAVTAILDDVVNITEGTQHVVQPSELQDFLQSADNVLGAHSEVWQDQTPVAQNLVNSVDRIGKAAAASGTFSEPIETDRLVLEVRKADLSDIEFPDPQRKAAYPAWVNEGGSSASLSRQAFPSSVTEVRYSAVIYRNLSNVFPTQLSEDLTRQANLSLNSPVLALSVLPEGDLQRPVKLAFEHLTGNFSNGGCFFLNFSESELGVWSDNECTVTYSNSTTTLCECAHLTNFAVLMSPYRPTSSLADVLNIFSIVGCSVSIFCLLLTVVTYRVLWRYVKSDRSMILMNLCVVLILAYVTFLAGVNRVEHKTVCTVVAALLHYLWLVVFFLMLCEGLDIFISIVIIFPTKSALLKMLLMAYGVPLVIVGASLGITRLEGYGGSDFCWLSLKNNLLWAFVGPALAALLANFFFVALVIRALLSTAAMITKANRERAKSVVRAICVMTPTLGLGWIFGVMAVNDDTLVFQVLFVVFNSLQGLMIFVLHCLLAKQVRTGFRNKRRQQQASASKYSVDSGASKSVFPKRTSESSVTSNDLGQSGDMPASPFLQVDRQVQQMVAKMNLMNSPNLLTPDDPPKDAALKDPVADTSSHGLGDSFLNIQLGESTTDDLPSEQEEAEQVGNRVGMDPSFRIQSGNLSTFSGPNPSIQTSEAPPTKTTKAVVEKEAVRHTSSLEDNEKQEEVNQVRMDPSFRIESGNLSSFSSRVPSLQTSETPATTTAMVEKEALRQTSGLDNGEKQVDIPMQSFRSSRSGSSDGRGEQRAAPRRQGQTTAGRDDCSRDGGRDRSRQRSKKLSETRESGLSIEEQRSRLDHVYGAGARISGDPNPNPSRPYVKGKNNARVIQSADNVAMMSAPKNPVYSDVVPPISPTDRWGRTAKGAVGHHHHHHNHNNHPHAHPHHHPPSSRAPPPPLAPFPHHTHHHNPRPASPRRLSTSADGFDTTSAFPRFSGPRQGEVRYVSGKKSPGPRPPPKPSRYPHEPPVDYW